MGRAPVPGTSVTLLGRLGEVPANPAAWDEFVERYGPVIVGWCRRWGLQELDAADVTQTVLLHMADKLRSFTYDPSHKFRAYLRTVTYNAWCDFVHDRERAGVGSGDTETLDLLASIEAREDLLQRLDETFDRELLEEAMTQVRMRVEPRTWQAFWQTAIDGRPPAEVASDLGLTAAAVYQARNRVRGMIQQVVQRFESADDS
jgi:RNA polymerase sigma factor (sigma-70 family)